MVATVCLIVSFLFFALRSKQVVPNRLQAAVELLFDFINTLIRSYIGTEGLPYAPLIFCLFFAYLLPLQILLVNLALLPSDLTAYC